MSAYKVFDLRCPKCDHEKTDTLVKGDDLPACDACGTRMAKLPPLVRTFTVGPGRSEESRAEHRHKLKVKLEKRSNDYDRTPRGKAQRAETIHRLRSQGVPV